jgi:hypothetical protein
MELLARDNGLAVPAEVLTEFTWDYTNKHEALRKLYEKGKTSQWNATTDIDWSLEVNFGEKPKELEVNPGIVQLMGLHDSPVAKYGEEGFVRFRWEFQAWTISQFLHGEQGALVAASRLVETVPDYDSKLYAANQAADEARHVEVYARYLNEKLRYSYPISKPLQELLVDIMSEKRWDIIYLGMQIMVEGLALAAFGLANVIFQDDLIKQITDYVMRDEARHVAFGVLSLQGLYDDMTDAELRDREEFLMEAATLMRDRFLIEEVWERMGIDKKVGMEFAKNHVVTRAFRQVLFSRIVPNLNKLGLLTERVKPKFAELGILEYANLPDSAAGLV